jgi:hypothetical protein
MHVDARAPGRPQEGRLHSRSRHPLTNEDPRWVGAARWPVRQRRGGNGGTCRLVDYRKGSRPSADFVSDIHIAGISDSRAKPLKSNAVNITGIVRNALILLGSPLFWEQGAGGSNPSAPTNCINGLGEKPFHSVKPEFCRQVIICFAPAARRYLPENYARSTGGASLHPCAPLARSRSALHLGALDVASRGVGHDMPRQRHDALLGQFCIAQLGQAAMSACSKS